jgi:hypothetical protein
MDRTLGTLFVHAYFVAGIISCLAALFAQKLLRKSPIFTHGKASSTVPASSCIERLLLPKRFFWHFYLLGVALSASALATLSFNLPTLLLFVQCSRRLSECFTILPGAASSASRMHLIHYLIGLSYYPVLLASYWLIGEVHLSKFELYTWTATFLAASVLQFHVHRVLGRERARLPPGKPHRPIKNRLFQFIHTPHYTAEVLIYLALAGCCRWHPLALINVLWVLVMLTVSSYNSACWMKEQWQLKSLAMVSTYLVVPFAI